MILMKHFNAQNSVLMGYNTASVGNQISEFKASSARVEASPQNVGMRYYPVTHHHSPEEENPQILQLALQ